MGDFPGQILLIFDAYVYPREEFETKFDVFPPFIFVLTIIAICTILVEPLGLFKEDQRDVAISSSVEPMRLEFLKCMSCYCRIYVGGRPGAGLCASFPFSVFA